MQIAEIAVKIAAQLPTVNGATWRVQDNDNHAHPTLELHHSGDPLGPELLLYQPHQRSAAGRVEISGRFPRHHWPTTARPSIGCSLDRGATAIARDIERRLLPEYLGLYDKAACEQAAQLADWKRRQEIARQLGQLAGLNEKDVRLGSDDPYGEEPRLWLPHHAQARVYADSVRFEYMSVPLPIARRIVAALCNKPGDDEQARHCPACGHVNAECLCGEVANA
jgi:hypothetical protein